MANLKKKTTPLQRNRRQRQKGQQTNAKRPKQPPNSETAAKTELRDIVFNIASGRILLMGATQFLTLLRTLAQHYLILLPVLA